MLGQIEWPLQNGPITKRSFASNYFIFFENLFQFQNLLKRVNLMYQGPKCPYSYFSLALKFNVRVLFPCEKSLENIKRLAISVHLLQCDCGINTGDFNILATDWVRLNYATTHHQPKYVQQHPPPSTTSQNISPTTYHFPKNGQPPRKSQNIFMYNLL